MPQSLGAQSSPRMRSFSYADFDYRATEATLQSELVRPESRKVVREHTLAPFLHQCANLY
jgi:hypothetical protein